jgi:cytoskeletal protein CcmA (bactofilin family)
MTISLLAHDVNLVVDLTRELVTTVIARSSTHTAAIDTDEGVLVLGRLKGDITSRAGTVFVAEDGVVEGHVGGRRVVIAGTVLGDVRGEDTVLLGHTARVIGNVIYKNLSLREDAVIEGRLAKIR